MGGIGEGGRSLWRYRGMERGMEGEGEGGYIGRGRWGGKEGGDGEE